MVADTISRRPDLQNNAMVISSMKPNDLKELEEQLPDDADFQWIYRTLKGEEVPRAVPTSLMEHYTLNEEGKLLYDRNRLCVPKGPLRAQILYNHHDAPISGHQGIERIYAAVHDLFYWPKMNADVRNYVKSCETCQRVKASQQLPGRLLQPLETPNYPWE